jgi:hypothetical protein
MGFHTDWSQLLENNEMYDVISAEFSFKPPATLTGLMTRGLMIMHMTHTINRKTC